MIYQQEFSCPKCGCALLDQSGEEERFGRAVTRTWWQCGGCGNRVRFTVTLIAGRDRDES